MYEKRRDWEKLLGLQRREAERLRRATSARAKFLEIAKLATERVKKPEVCIELWQEVLANDDGERRGARRARRALRARARTSRSSPACSRSRPRSRSTAPAKIQILTKLGTIYGDRLNNDEGAVNAWRALLALDPNDRTRAGRAEEEVPRARPLGRPRGLLRRERQVGRVHPRPRAAGGEGDRLRGEDRAALQDRRSSGRTRSRSSIAPPRPTRRSSSSSRTTSQAAEALIPIYTQAEQRKALANAIEVKLGHEEDAVREARALREVAALYEGKVKDPQKAFDRYLAAFELFPGDERTTEDVERAAKATGRLGRGRRRLPHARSRRRTRAATRDARHHAAPAARSRARRRDAADRRGARRRTAPSTRPTARTPRPSRALERLYRHDVALRATCSASTRRSAISRPTTARRRRSTTRSPSSTRTRSRTSTGRSTPTCRCSRTSRPTRTRSRRSTSSTAGSSGGSRTSTSLRRRIELDVGEARAHRPQVPPRRRRSRSTSATPPARSRTTARSSSSTRSTRARATALEAMLQSAELRARGRAILESIYEERGDWPKLHRTRSRSSARAEGDIEKRVAAQAQGRAHQRASA